MLKIIDTVILGAGLAGLAAAHRLKRGYLLVEATNKAGGLCETIEEDGFHFDRTGHLLHLRHKKIRNMVLRLLDEEPIQIERESRIFSHGVYTPYPFQANTYGLPTDVVAECLTGYIESIASNAELQTQPKTFEEFIYRHFGRGIAKHFMIPYNTKLWGVHPRQITADWCTRFVPMPKPDEVVSGALGLPQKRMGYNARFLYPKNGIEELPRALARRVSQIRYRLRPRAIDPRRRRIFLDGEWLPYRSIISTIPLKNLIQLIEGAPNSIQNTASRLRCSSLRYLDVALKKPVGTPYHWTYVPESQYPFYRVGCYSNFSPSMAPPGKSNLYVELATRKPLDLESLMPHIERGLLDMGIIKNSAHIESVRTRRIAHGYVVYNHTYSKDVSSLLSWLENKRIFSAGRYAKWEYSAMEDALFQGIEAADKVRKLDL